MNKKETTEEYNQRVWEIIQRNTLPHIGEFLLDGFEIVKLLGIEDHPDDDIFYLIQPFMKKPYYKSVLFGYITLKDKLSEKEYKALEYQWKINLYFDHETNEI